MLEVDGGKGWLESRLFPLFVEEAITGIVNQLHAIQDAPEPMLMEPKVSQVVSFDPRRVLAMIFRMTQAGANST